jgi:hypothetical protein
MDEEVKNNTPKKFISKRADIKRKELGIEEEKEPKRSFNPRKPPYNFVFNKTYNMNDVDVIDTRCKKGEEVEHQDYCTCGIIEMDDDGNPILYYNKKNQIFLLENSAQVFTPPQTIKDDIINMNLTNSLIKKCKNRKLDKEQRDRYIELGKMCEECSSDD